MRFVSPTLPKLAMTARAGILALVSLLPLALWAQTHEVVTFRYQGAIGANKKAFVLGNLPELGNNDVTQAVTMEAIAEDVWEIDVSLPVNRDYTYQFYSRGIFGFESASPSNGTPLGAEMSASTSTVVLDPATKTIAYRGVLANPVLHWHQDEGAVQSVTLSETDGWFTATGIGEANKAIAFFFTDGADTSREPAALGGAPEDDPVYTSTGETLYVQNEALFLYEPNATVSPPRRDDDPNDLPTVTSAILGEERPFRVLLPRGYDEHTDRYYPLVCVAFGQALFEDDPNVLGFAHAPEPALDPNGMILSDLMATGQTHEVIIVGIDLLSRSALTECAALGDTVLNQPGTAETFADFLKLEFLPEIQNRYRVLRGASNTAFVGYELGANLALYLGWDHHHYFGKIGAIQPELLPNLESALSTETNRSIRLYIDSGTKDFGQVNDTRRSLVTKHSDRMVIERDLRRGFADVSGSSPEDYRIRLGGMMRFLFPADEAIDASASNAATPFWLSHYGLTTADWDLDLDGDGQTTRQEYAAGTDPTDGASFLDFGAESTPDRAAFFEWQSRAGAAYQFEWSMDLVDWQPLGEAFYGTGEFFESTLPFDLNEDRQFVRVLAHPPMDSDRDGLSDIEEGALLGTNHLLPDTDGDGFGDGEEVLFKGTDPLVPNFTAGSIAGQALIDEDGDGNLGGEDPALGTVIFLDLDDNGVRGENEPFTAAGSDGHYTFTDVSPGTYRVMQELPLGWIQTVPGGIPATPDGLPDAIESFDHSGEGAFPFPYGFNATASWEPPFVVLGKEPEAVDPNILLKPIGNRGDIPPIGLYNTTEVLALSKDSTVTVRFDDEQIIDGPGNDFQVVTSANNFKGERFEVSVGKKSSEMVFLAAADEGGPVGFDLERFGIDFPISYIRVKSLNNGGSLPGLDLTGFEAINYVPQETDYHVVTVDEGEAVTDVDFGRMGRDLPPKAFISTSADHSDPKAGDLVPLQVSGTDDFGVASLSLTANGAHVSLDADGNAMVTAAWPGQLILTATATDAAGQTGESTLTLAVRNADGTIPSSPNAPSLSERAANAPQIQIETPGSGVVIDGDTAVVGTITDGDLVSWEVHYALVDAIDPYDLSADDPDYVLLGQGNEVVVNASLATLPGDTLADGVYFIRVSATDESGLTAHAGHAFGLRVSTEALYPSISIASPTFGENITYLTDIVGTITSSHDIHEWYVDYALASEVDLNQLDANPSAYTRLAESTALPDPDTVLASLDATLLKNNAYVIRVTVWNDIGLGWTDAVLVNVEGNVKLGRLRQDFTDLTVALAGLPIEIKRTYDSFDTDVVGDFGHGWSLGYANPQLNETEPDNGAAFSSNGYKVGTRIYLNSPSGQRIGFTFGLEAAQLSYLGTSFRAVFTPDPGVYETLEVPERDQGFLSQNSLGEATLFFIGFPYNPDEFILTTKDGTEYAYHETEGLLGVTDEAGNQLLFSETGIRHSSGAEVTFTRDTLGRITTINSPDGASWQYGYDANGDLVSVTDPTSTTTTFRYYDDPAHYLKEITDPLGRKGVRYEYDAEGRLAAIIDENGNRSEQTWDLNGFSGSVSDYRGNVTTLRYDARGNLLQEELPNGGVIMRAYEDPTNPDLETSVTDAKGHVTTYTYDTRGNQTKIQPPSGRATEMTYNEANQVTLHTFPSLRTEEMTYSEVGKLIERKFSNTVKRYFTHNNAGQTATYMDATGREWFYDYSNDPFEQLNAITLFDGTTIAATYHSSGLIASLAMPDGGTTTFSYDAKHRLTTREDAFGNETQVTYLADKVKTITDPAGLVTDHTFDSRGNLTQETIGTATAVYGYDADDNRTSVTDPTGNTTTTSYNAGNKVVTETDPNGNMTTHTYDLSGNRLSTIDRNGRKRTFVYDDQNRMTTERWHDPSDDAVIHEMTFEYSRNQVLSSVTDGDLEYSFSRVATPEITTFHMTFPEGAQRSIHYVYEDLDQVRRVRLGATDLYRYTRDHSGNVGIVQLNAPGSDQDARFDIHRNYSSQSRVYTRYDEFTTITNDNLVGTTTVDVDLDGLPLVITHKDGTGTPYVSRGTLTLTRNARRGLATADDGANLASYGYDSHGQVTNVTNSTRANESYAYDLNGNRALSGDITSTGNRLSETTTHEYEYDLEGNLTQRRDKGTGEIMDLAWDHRNRLTKVVLRPSIGASATKTVVYHYDYRDLMIGRTEDGGTTAWTLYGRDDMPLCEFTGAGAEPSRIFYYVPGDNADQFIAEWREGKGLRWLHTDHLGSVRSVTDISGNQIATIDYDAFGQTVALTETAAGDAGDLRFAGRLFDEATGFYYNRARWMDPNIGRFLSEDPIGFEGGDLNLYRYAANNPISQKDPTGNSVAAEYGEVVKQVAERAIENGLELGETIDDCFKGIAEALSSGNGGGGGAACVPGMLR